MENNEDEPDDVKRATPVVNAVLDGNKDEENRESIKRKKPKSPSGTLNNNRGESKGRRCNLYKGKFPPPTTKAKKPCHPKAEIICRENLSKDEYIDVLSTPKKSGGSTCREMKSELTDSSKKRMASGRKPSCKEKATLPRPMSHRLEELAKPKPSHIMDLLQTWGSRLRPEIIDSVQKSLQENCTMSPEQMEAFYNDKENEDCSRVHRVRRKKCPAEKERKKTTCDDHMDPQAVCEEYEMARRFMRHIISHLKNCQFAPEDHYDLTEVILSQLGSVLDYRPSGDGDRKFQMMFMLANGIACWVHGLNVSVAEKLAKQQAEDAKEEIEIEESESEDEEGEKQEGEEITDGEGGKEDADLDEDGEEGEGKDDDDENKQGENDEVDIKDEPIGNEVTSEVDDDLGDGDDLSIEPKEENEDGTDVEIESEEEQPEEGDYEQEEPEEPSGEKEEFEPETETEVSDMDEKFIDEDDLENDKEVGDETEDEETTIDEETIEDIPSDESIIDPGLDIQELGEGDLFESEIPFITFGKIMQIVVKFLERFEEAETTEIRRRLQNAILKKLTKLIIAEAPDSLDDNMKAVLEVLAENIAVFMEDTLPKSKVNDIQTMAPQIESTEVRNWGHWLETIMDNATNWGKWIHEKVSEAEEKARTKVTRGDWQDWTSTVNREALRWRMFNLDTKHRMHHADLNLTHKKVVHRGEMRTGNVIGNARMAPYKEKDETEINAYDLSDEANIGIDQDEQFTDYNEESED